MKTINEIQDEIVAEFSEFEDWMDRYSLLIDLAGEMPPMEESLKTEQNLIDGCQSKVWIDAKLEEADGVKLIRYRGDSDAILVRGIVALLIRVLSDHTPQEICESDLYFIDQIGLREHLSPTRSNGLLAMLRQMKMYAIAYNAKS